MILGYSIALIMLIGGTFNGLYETTGNNYWQCNYLFMFDKAGTTNILGFVGPLFDINIAIGGFFKIRLIQLVVFVAFSLICTGAFFALKPLSKIGTKCPDAPKYEEQAK